MIAALQVLIILSILAILGIIVGYLIGKISCKRQESGSYIEKSSFCEQKAKEITKEQNDLLEKESLEITENLNQASTPAVLLNNNSIDDNSVKKKVEKETTNVTSTNKEEKVDSISNENKFNNKESSIEVKKELEETTVNNTSTNNSSSIIDKNNTDNTIKESKTEVKEKIEDNTNSDTAKDTKNSSLEDSNSKNKLASKELTAMSSTTDIKKELEDPTLNNSSNSKIDENKIENTTKESQENIEGITNSNFVKDNANSLEDNNNKDKTINKPLAAISSTTIDNKSKKEESIKETAETKENKTVTLKEQLNSLDVPNNNKADNLCEIKGIGKVIEGKLNTLGIYHFYQIAAWGEKEITLVDAHLAFKGRIAREKWIEQAKLLAKGMETEFAKRVKKGEVPTSSTK